MTTIAQRPTTRSRPWDATLALFREASRSRSTRWGLVCLGVVLAVVIIGPFVAPHPPTEFVARNFAPPSEKTLLGTDAVGRDVLSRFLSGGGTLLLVSFLATLLGVASGTAVGVFAGYSRRAGDEILMRTMDVLLAFPPIVLALMFVAATGPELWLIVVVVAISHMPQTARVVRTAVSQVRDLDFLKYAEGVGLSRGRILRGQVLPNIVAPLAVEFGLRLTFSIGLIASLDYLGLGVQPPTADWGLMIQENQSGLTVSPWPVAVAVAAIAVLTIGTNLVTDGIARAAGGLDRRLES